MPEKDRMKKKKIIYTVCASVLLFALYGLIFGFSSQDGETSGGISLELSRWSVELLNDVSGRPWTDKTVLDLSAYFEYPLRKTAHFMEYALLGFLGYSIVLCWTEEKKKWSFWVVLWIVLSAAADEFHQYFVPGRYASVWDVLLDSLGGIFGMIFCGLLLKRD